MDADSPPFFSVSRRIQNHINISYSTLEGVGGFRSSSQTVGHLFIRTGRHMTVRYSVIIIMFYKVL
jgi:hypothetical protein